ncbi:amidohydrolase family protein [Aquimarina sp. D1M17]|uniref:amidohydrolase family protein n=1 Tax=Aquimarina acroporae TaxID=2937283 RepID=UPI0020BF903E|nr:amidohydrolase family protein [Aquimarina acroporae]MCK8520148.1 amidohydrolase family protein [Aquimarina acroporae]
MKRKSIKKWVLGLVMVLITISIGSCIGVKSQIKQHSGGKTDLVDITKFKTDFPTALAITNVNVLSTDCSKMKDSLTVLINVGKIVAVGKEVPITNEYTQIDGTGQYLIPGLVDSHVHLKDSKNDLLLYLANGITYVCEMTGSQRHLDWREEAKKGMLSPKIYVASRKVGSQKGFIRKIKGLFFDQPLNYTSEKTARTAVRKFKKQGFDAIKLNGTLNEEIYHAINDEAQKQDIPTVGHLSFEVGLDGFYSSGQSQLSHVEEITKNTMHTFDGVWYKNTKEYLKYLKENADAIAVKLKENNIVISSTISIVESIPEQNFNLENFLKSIELEYQNPGLIEGSKLSKGWLPGNNSYENIAIKANPKLASRTKLFWKTYVDAYYIMTNALIKNGVTVTAGTDANVTGAVPGFSLHNELKSLEKCGMSNAEILYAATIAPANWMQSTTGKVENGYDADLVLLGENPLENIDNTKTINAVITNGKFLNRTMLNQMLLMVKETNNQSRKISINQYL